jgi:hypothetical protein
MGHNFNRGFFFKKLFFGIIFIAAITLVTFILWNWLMPAIFGLPVISYLQAFGILILSKILLCGFGRFGHHDHRRREYWKKKFEDHNKDFPSGKAGEEKNI